MNADRIGSKKATGSLRLEPRVLPPLYRWLSENTGRKRKTDRKAFSSRHNDRNFDSNLENIAKDKSDKNVI